MKTTLTLLASLILATTAFAGEKVEAGPRKGRILPLTASKAEFFIEPDRTISIVFYDAAMKPVAPAQQTFSATAEAPSGRKKLEFERKGDQLVTKDPLPEGTGYIIAVQARESAEAKPKIFRIKLDLSSCKGCPNPEYACTCDE